MRLYLDASCLNRPADDQHQPRIRLESEAVVLIIERVEAGRWEHVASQMVLIEIDANPDATKRRRARQLLPPPSRVRPLTETTWARARDCESMGFKPADAVHVAAAEEAAADVLLTCDDRMLRTARRNRRRLRIRVENPLQWLQEQRDDADA